MALTLSGCVTGQQLTKIERQAASNAKLGTAPNFSPTKASSLSQLGEYAFGLSRGYLDVADRAALGRDAVSVLLVASAASGAVGVLDGRSTEALGRLAVQSLAVSGASDFLNPKTASDGLFLAARRLSCISGVAATAEVPDFGRAKLATLAGIATVQIQAREGLRGKAIDYSALASEFATAVKKKEEKATEVRIATFRSSGVNSRELNNLRSAFSLAEYNVEIDSCVLTGKSASTASN